MCLASFRTKNGCNGSRTGRRNCLLLHDTNVHSHIEQCSPSQFYACHASKSTLQKQELFHVSSVDIPERKISKHIPSAWRFSTTAMTAINEATIRRLNSRNFMDIFVGNVAEKRHCSLIVKKWWRLQMVLWSTWTVFIERTQNLPLHYSSSNTYNKYPANTRINFLLRTETGSQ